MFALTDEAYALTLQAERNNYSSTRITAIQGLLHASWTTSVLAGTLLGSLIPEAIKGLEFAVTALFAVLAIEAFKAYRSIPLSLAGLAVDYLLRHFRKKEAMPDNLYLFSAIAASTAVTFGLRAMPFAFIAKLRSNGVINYLACACRWASW